MNKGKIVQVIGPVVDIEFADKLPAIYNALTVEFTSPGAAGKTKLTLEVQQHLGDNWVRAIAMSSTEGLKRGMEITDTGAPISMPVGELKNLLLEAAGDPAAAAAGAVPQHLFEPSAEQVLSAILPIYVDVVVYQVLLEAKASEHSSRMVAMKNATDNAMQLIKDLTLEYNKLRQANITKELLEITTAQMAMG